MFLLAAVFLVFGTGGGVHALYVNETLSGGYAAIGYTYGDPDQYGEAAYRNAFTGSYGSWTIGELEVFTISQDNSPVPEPSTMLLMGLGLLGLAGFGRKKAIKS